MEQNIETTSRINENLGYGDNAAEEIEQEDDSFGQNFKGSMLENSKGELNMRDKFRTDRDVVDRFKPEEKYSPNKDKARMRYQ